MTNAWNQICQIVKDKKTNAWNQICQFGKDIRRLGKDEEGAALIEYTVLLGILVVAVIATIVAVGTWVNGRWSFLQSKLS